VSFKLIQPMTNHHDDDGSYIILGLIETVYYLSQQLLQYWFIITTHSTTTVQCNIPVKSNNLLQGGESNQSDLPNNHEGMIFCMGSHWNELLFAASTVSIDN
jgi:hypothetical protein